MTQPVTAPPSGLVGVDGACAYLAIKKTTLYRLMGEGLIESVLLPSDTGQRRARKFRVAELDRFIATLAAQS